MNYFEDHIGDYAAATAHLSWDEDMAYTRLIRAYYHTEKPIPKGQAYRLARASTAAHRRAVDAVLQEFFEQREDGFHQKRCDEEIIRFHEKQGKARASAMARWSAQPSQSGRNANAQESKGLNGATDAMRTHCEGNAPIPSPNNQTPEENPPKPPRKRRGAAGEQLVSVEQLVSEGVEEQHAKDWLTVRKEKKRPLTPTAWDGVKSEAAAAGLDLRAAIKTAVENGWAGFKAKWLTEGDHQSGGAKSTSDWTAGAH